MELHCHLLLCSEIFMLNLERKTFVFCNVNLVRLGGSFENLT